MMEVPETAQQINRMNQRNRWKHSRAVSLVLGLLLPGFLWGQAPSSVEPVPLELLQGGELIVGSRNFAVTTPPGDWRWFLAKGQAGQSAYEAYVCRETDSGAEFQVVSTGIRTHLDARFVTGYTEGATESLTDAGRKVVSMSVTDSTVPAPHSYRGQWHALLPDGASIYGYSYLTGSDTIYALQHITTDANEPPMFTQFARTFRTLNAPPPHAESGSRAMGYVLLVGMGCAIAGVVNRIYGRTILNGGTVGAVLVITLTVVLMLIGGYVAISTDQPPEKTGEFMGRRVGEALIPLLLAVLASHFFRRPNRRTSVPDEGLQTTNGPH